MNIPDLIEEKDDLIFSKMFSHPLDDTLKALLADVQRDRRCKNKVPVLEIADGRECFLIVPRRRLRAILTKLEKQERKQGEKQLLRLAKRG